MKKNKVYIYQYPYRKAELFHRLNGHNGYCHNLDIGEYLIDIKDEDRFFLGIARGGHRGGYWYVARIEKDNDHLLIRGSIVYNPDANGNAQTETMTLWDKISTTLLCILLFPLIVLVWLVQASGNLFCRICKKPKLWPTDEEKLDYFMVTYLGCKKM